DAAADRPGGAAADRGPRRDSGVLRAAAGAYQNLDSSRRLARDLAQLAQQLRDKLVHIRALRAAPTPVGQDLAQLREAALQIIVDQDMIIFGPVRDLFDRV